MPGLIYQKMKKIVLFMLVCLSVVSCKKDSSSPALALDNTSLELNYDKEHQFVAKKGNENITAASVKWTSSDVTVGTIDGNGLFKAKKIGKTVIKADDAQCEVTIAPYSNLCKEPIVDFTASMAVVKGKETRKLESETSTGLLYVGDNLKIRNVMYIFENSKLNAAAILMANTSAVVEESSNFFKERYTLLMVDGGAYYYTDNKSMVAVVSVNTSLGFNAIYMPYTPKVAIARQSYKEIMSSKMILLPK